MYYQKYKFSSAKKQTGLDGKMFDSKFEAGYANDLYYRKKAKDIKDYETHKRLPLIVNNYHVADYLIDFVIYHNDDTVEYVETKGRIDKSWVLKFKILEAMIADDPNITLTLVKQGKTYNPRKPRKLS